MKFRKASFLLIVVLLLSAAIATTVFAGGYYWYDGQSWHYWWEGGRFHRAVVFDYAAWCTSPHYIYGDWKTCVPDHGCIDQWDWGWHNGWPQLLVPTTFIMQEGPPAEQAWAYYAYCYVP